MAAISHPADRSHSASSLKSFDIAPNCLISRLRPFLRQATISFLWTSNPQQRSYRISSSDVFCFDMAHLPFLLVSAAPVSSYVAARP
jgi:hypothetical protein